jgi:hypothetical protein
LYSVYLGKGSTVKASRAEGRKGKRQEAGGKRQEAGGKRQEAVYCIILARTSPLQGRGCFEICIEEREERQEAEGKRQEAEGRRSVA